MKIKKEDLKAIFIVAGHGEILNSDRKDPGAIANGTTERKEASEMAFELFELLRNDENFKDVKIYDVGIVNDLDLIEKSDYVNVICQANKFNARNSILISIHLNAGGGEGVESWHYRDSEESKKLGAYLSAAISMKLSIRHRGDKDEKNNRHGKLHIVHETIPLACLIEASFIDNKEESKIFKDDKKDDDYAIAMLEGIYGYFEMELKKLTKHQIEIMTAALFIMKIMHGAGTKEMKLLAERFGKEVRKIHPLP